MRNNSFQCYRSINNKLHNKITQQDQYARYLKRINNIVDRSLRKDESPDQYMQFLHKIKNVSRGHRHSQEETRIVVENKHLLDKILKNRTRKFHVPQEAYPLALHEKRNREFSKINEENKKMAKRIIEQHSTLRKTLTSSRVNEILDRSFEKKKTQRNLQYQLIKARKLPKLVGESNGSSEYFDGSESSMKVSQVSKLR